MKIVLITKRKYPWVGEQTWENILFMHWPVSEEQIRPFVPDAFHIDTYEGKAWISIVVFQAKDSLVRGMPKVTSFPPVTQINIRTYVYLDRNMERGVYFFSLRVDSLLAVLGARTLYSLPFYYRDNFFAKHGSITKITSSVDKKQKFSVRFEPKKETVQNKKVADFLTERYCIWNLFRNRVIKIPIRHRHWDLYDVHVDLEVNELLSNWDTENSSIPHLAQYSPYKHALLYPFETYS